MNDVLEAQKDKYLAGTVMSREMLIFRSILTQHLQRAAERSSRARVEYEFRLECEG